MLLFPHTAPLQVCVLAQLGALQLGYMLKQLIADGPPRPSCISPCVVRRTDKFSPNALRKKHRACLNALQRAMGNQKF